MTPSGLHADCFYWLNYLVSQFVYFFNCSIFQCEILKLLEQNTGVTEMVRLTVNTNDKIRCFDLVLHAGANKAREL